MAERCEGGQAQIELVAGIPLVLLAIAVVVQLFGVLHAQSTVDGAAEVAALAAADGRDARAAALEAMPGWAREDIDVSVDGGHVRIEARPPTIVPWLAGRLAVSTSAYARTGN